MKKVLFLVVIALLVCGHAWAKHEKGGYITYEYQGPSSDSTKSIYKITATVFFSCTQQGPYSITMNIYDKVTKSYVTGYSFSGPDNEETVQKTTFSSCISNPPTICYLIYTYSKTVTLSNNTNGYTIGVLTAGHRVDNMVNISSSGNTSLALTADIPGMENGVDYHTNTSPTFLFKDTAIICYGSYFEYQFTAEDLKDNDSISYAFGNGLDGGSSTSLPTTSVTYTSGYSSKTPLGSKVTLDPKTGLISGIAPTEIGEYIVDVFAKEWRNGVLIDSIRKELQVYVNNCSLLSAELKEVYVNCDSLTLSFQNESPASNITKYLWNFGDNTTSTSPTVTHTYLQAGEYTLTLAVSNNSGCNNSTTAKVKVYPGFNPSFKTVGSCYQSPITFINTTYAQYGSINSWEWHFGDPRFAATADSNLAYTDTASHYYAIAQTATVIMKVGSTVGCSGSDTMQVVINDKPYIYLLPNTDTVICDKDSLTITAQTSATVYSWSPQINMIDSTTLTPTVFPKTNTTYTITAQQGGCVGTASVLVKAVPYITVSFNPDTLHACKKDSIVLNPNTLASTFLWTETGTTKTLSNDTIRNPKASPHDDITTFHVSANLGRCPAQASIKVYASPLPTVNITGPLPDTTICYGGTVPLRAIKTGAIAKWTPTAYLSDASITSPIATPVNTTTYTLTVRDTFYCSKSVSESVLINVVPPFKVSAGNDTAVILGEQLAISAFITDTSFSYPVSYNWSPSKFIDYVDSPNITITGLPPAPDSIKYRVIATTTNKQHCTDTGYVTVKFFNTKPDIFVPSAFTPNGDGHNDVLKPIPVGIARFQYFKVYDRYGQLVYSTTQVNEGWDGYVNGTMANTGTFVYVASGIDYLHNPVFKKGTVVLIR